jgi:hypothetical protein
MFVCLQNYKGNIQLRNQAERDELLPGLEKVVALTVSSVLDLSPQDVPHSSQPMIPRFDTRLE